MAQDPGSRGSEGNAARSGSTRPFRWVVVTLATVFALTAPAGFPGAHGAAAQDPGVAPGEEVDLTLERLVELSLSSSYRVRFLNMGVEQTRARLRAQTARLRSRVWLDVSAPDFQSISETQYNSNLGRNEIVHENSRRWEAQLSVRQPVILFGYPTNGYLSLNNRVYRYTQIGDQGERDIDYYNRYFVRYTQPLFQPNSLKNDLERAELDLEDEEIEFREDILDLVDDAADDYYDLFGEIYERNIRQDFVEKLERATGIARSLAAEDPERQLDVQQLEVETTNAREDVSRAESDVRRQRARLRTDLNLAESVQLDLHPVIDVETVSIDVEEATRYALELTPEMQQLTIQRRQNEMRLEETRGRNSFRVDLEFTYGREARNPTFDQMWADPANTYTVDVSAQLPIWDWGERNARIQASEISVERTDLRFEQSRAQIESNVENEVRNIEELQDRVLTMSENLERAAEIAEESLERYEAGSISVLDLLQALRREADTADNFVDAYLGWRSSLQRLQQLTYYDFEYDMPVLDRFGIDLGAMQEMVEG